VGGNPYLIESSAAFEVQSTTEGLYPQITTLQRDAIAAPATGLTIFNTTAVCLQWYRGAANGGWYDPVEPEFPQSLVLLLRESGWIATWELIRA
jgi:hypothetical protein